MVAEGGDRQTRRDMLAAVIRGSVAARDCALPVKSNRADRGWGSRMTMNDLTAPLGQDPNKPQRAVAIPAAKIIAVALGLFFAAFVLWAIIAEDRFGGQPIAIAPADLQHIAKKAPAVIAVPQAAAPVDAAQATTATLPPAAPAPQPAGPAKPPGTVTITIVDGKTGATRQVVVASPPQPESPDTTGQLPPGPPARKR